MKPLLILGSAGLCFLAALAKKPSDPVAHLVVEVPRSFPALRDDHGPEHPLEKGIEFIAPHARSSLVAMDHAGLVLHWGDGGEEWPLERMRRTRSLAPLDEEDGPCDAQGELLPDPTVDRGVLILEHLRQSLRLSTAVATPPVVTEQNERTDPRNYGLWLQANEPKRPLQRRSIGNQGLVLETLPPWHLDHAEDDLWHDLPRTTQAMQERMDEYQQLITDLSHELEKLNRQAPVEAQ